MHSGFFKQFHYHSLTDCVAMLLGFAEPLSLERLSRLTVRQHLQSLNRLDDIKHLPLPNLLRDFVEQADKVADEK